MMPSSPTFASIDYRVRLAKNIERRMIVDALIGLRRVADISMYRYIGFGAVAYVDFVLLHRALGITDMITIEDAANGERVRFNRPYSCITVELGRCSEVLDRLEWTKRSIVWLDYDKNICDEFIEDVGRCAARLPPKSVLIVTLRCNSRGRPQEELRLFKKRVSPHRHPSGLGLGDFAGGGYQELLRRVLRTEIRAKLGARNALLVGNTGSIVASQVLNISYADGATMATFAWIVEEAGAETVRECSMDALPFYRPESDVFRIAPPVLTPKEVRYLNAQLPLEADGSVECPGVPELELKNYATLYRHYPLFTEVLDT